jgi:hypothetical protein
VTDLIATDKHRQPKRRSAWLVGVDVPTRALGAIREEMFPRGVLVSPDAA